MSDRQIMYRHLMRLMSKSGLLADSKGQMSTLSRADCMEKQDLSDPQKESKFILLARSTCYPCWKLPALHKACLHPPFFFFFFIPTYSPLHLSVTFRGVGRTAQGHVSEGNGGRTPVLRAPGPSTWPVASLVALPTLPVLCCNWGEEVKTKGGNVMVNGSLQPGAWGQV